jgi:hypothetical protein
MDILVEGHWSDKRRHAKNALVAYGEKYFSQNDEDGILLEILKRMGLRTGTFIEFGCGDGLENNSIILLLSGWRGMWVGNEELAFDIPEASRLIYVKAWVTRENCCPIISAGLKEIPTSNINVLSIDLDGNDYYYLGEILRQGFTPDIIIIEYNGKIPPPISFVIPYDPKHIWDLTDKFGASLQALCDLVEPFRYSLVCCNLTGTNAFFVRDEYVALFPEVPKATADIFIPADYNWFFRRGHKVSPCTVALAASSEGNQERYRP